MSTHSKTQRARIAAAHRKRKNQRAKDDLPLPTFEIREAAFGTNAFELTATGRNGGRPKLEEKEKAPSRSTSNLLLSEPIPRYDYVKRRQPDYTDAHGRLFFLATKEQFPDHYAHYARENPKFMKDSLAMFCLLPIGLERKATIEFPAADERLLLRKLSTGEKRSATILDAYTPPGRAVGLFYVS